MSNKNKIFRKNFEIYRSSFFMQCLVENFYLAPKAFLGRPMISKTIWINEGENNIGTYFLKDEMKKMINLTLNKIVHQPDQTQKNQDQTIKYNDQLFTLLKKIENLNIHKLSNRQLVNFYFKAYDLTRLSHSNSLCSTWFVDSDGEDLTNYLFNLVKEAVRENKLNLEPSYVFSILTTPTIYSFGQIESIESFKVLEEIHEIPLAKKLFLKNSVKSIEESFNLLDKRLRNKIKNHLKKWRWMPYAYTGPAYDLDYYLTIWSGLLKQGINFKRELVELRNIHKKNLAEKNNLFKVLKFTPHDKKVFDVASQIVWLKGYRKDVLFYCCYIMDKIYQEIGTRLNLSLSQSRYLLRKEIKEALLKGKLNINEINSRSKFYVSYASNGKIKIFTGDAAKKFIAKQKFEKIKLKNVAELNGTTACPGEASGQVKIINLPEEMVKMNEGDIMVSHTTFPSLVPAIKKSSALITDDGGLTCHAAIVAREMKKPCVVGTKIATQILRDGDLVEVNATKGIVKIIKRYGKK